MPALMANLVHLSRLAFVVIRPSSPFTRLPPFLYCAFPSPPRTLLAASSRGITVQPDDAPSYHLPISKGHSHLEVGNDDVVRNTSAALLHESPHLVAGSFSSEFKVLALS
ncbi:hypothetical protein CCMA1212_005288 [Trichoderma ghanense]|uniref:Uncharacterized protein n=1 Tax=Trichoderma ghanense TaxID=65468 RepID=A0ABY2H2W7_9HYPO